MSRSIIFCLETVIKLNLLLIAFLNIQFSAAKSINFRLKIVHRDSSESPVYPGNLTFDYIGFSKARASYLMSSISTHNKKSAIHPVLKLCQVDPIFDPKASDSFREVSCVNSNANNTGNGHNKLFVMS
ncbi:hypothetical protein QYF36_012494 [Acer negundo]|nr:hypothetical protein QYF36_012494 [Acer negundo]